jgi:lysozyme
MKRVELFSELRNYAPDKRFTPAMVTAIDDLADLFGLARLGSEEWLAHAMALIKRFEGCELTAYPDPGTGGKPWTIGWGSITDAKGNAIPPGTTWTQGQADARLAAHVLEFADNVEKALAGSPTTPMQKGAMVSLAYNIGSSAFAGSTLLKKHRAADYDGAAAQFPAWNKSGGRVMQGLVNRRASEMRVYKGLPL